ncbi:MAG: CcmD family protein [Caldilineaceae bacterium]|nr:CcmD family protein [Caldilineaceae bacterium]MBP8110293.1 CcmD family protein [Caldilineaceae bacterium]MBP8123969.1 CcmD family protein [Caldilineaceae bacterium]MBP9074036.1 CcmD family protein [Caldilineaceae bacterium]
MEFLAAAFGLMWLLVTLYVLFMFSRQRGLEREIRMLEEIMEDRRKKGQI